jgi:hypothetical protein
MSTPSLLNIPYVIKAGTLYSQIPETGAGDFVVTRVTTPTANRSTRINANGLLELVNDNVPRLDYPRGGAVNGCASLLVEPSATNNLQRSEEFDNSYWTKANGIATPTTETAAPDGNLTAETYVVNNGAAGNSPIVRILSLLANTAYTLSVFVKRRDYDTATVRIYTDETSFATCTFNLSTGTATGGSILNFGNGWYRVSVTLTTAATVTNSQVQLIRDAQIRDGVAGIYIWGAQLETGTVPTSYIPTTTQAITRNTDVIRKTGITSLIGQSEGTIYFEVEVTDEARNKWIYTLDSSTTSFIQMWVSTTGTISVQIQNNSSIVMTTLISSAQSVGYHKVAFAYNTATNGCIMYIDGVQNPVATRTIAAPGLPAFDNMSLGTFVTQTSAVLKAHIRADAVYPNRLSNSELATLTTP